VIERRADRRGEAPVLKERWSHPYFWAPFILMGEYLQT